MASKAFCKLRCHRICLSQIARSQGVALVLVLWVLVLLSMLATHLSFASRSEAKLASNLVIGARLQHAADAGVRWAMWSLTAPAQERWLADGMLHQMELDGMTVHAALYDEFGKIDLNYATPERLTALLDAADVPEEENRFLVDAIIDWRDSDQLRRLNGAEDEDYVAAGLNYGAKDAPFESTDELTRVLGMTDQIYQRIKHAVTVYSRKSTINPLVAPRLVLMSLPGASADLVDDYIETRRANHLDGLPPPETPPFEGRFISSSLQSVYYTIHTSAEFEARGARQLSVVIRNRGVARKVRFQIVQVIQERSSFSSE